MFDRTSLSKSAAHKWFAGAVAGATVLASLLSTPAMADPAQDAVTKIGELSRQAEQLTEQMHAAELDLDKKVQAQTAAEQSHANDLAALDAARLQLSSYQGSVNTLAASVYMGGRTDGLNAILTAASPQGLIDKMAVQRVMGIEMAAQMQSGQKRISRLHRRDLHLKLGLLSLQVGADGGGLVGGRCGIRRGLG